MSLHRPLARALRPATRSLLRSSPVTGSARSYASIPTPGSDATLRRNAILAAGLLTTSAVLYYYELTTSDPSTAISSFTNDTFSITAGGKNYSFNHLPEAEAEAKLVANEETREINRAGNPVFKVDRSWLGSNEPCEDRMAADLVPRDTLPGATKQPARRDAKEGSNDLVFASVLDGHAGDATSILLSSVLHPTLTVALAGLQSGHAPELKGWQAILQWTNPMSWIGGAVWTSSNIAQTIQNA